MSDKKQLSFGTRLRNYFLAGILVTAPAGITFWLSWRVITLIDNRVTPYIPPEWNPETYLPFGIPGLGLIVALLFLVLVGFLAAGYVGRATMQIGERIVARLPVVRSVYGWTKQLLETVLSQSSTAFREVVLVEYPRRGSWAVGFITGETVGEVQRLTAETVYNVFIPATPNPTTGFLLFVPRRDVHHLDLTVEEGIKLVISSGIVIPDRSHEDEEEEETGVEAAKAQIETQVEKALRRRGKKEKPRAGFITRLRNYFFAGILVTAPIAITVWLASEFVTFVDGQVVRYIPERWNPETYLPFSLPGLGVVVVVITLVLIGFFTAGILGRSLIAIGERILAQMPVIRSLYSAVKQIIETVFKEQSEAFREVVLLEYPRPDCWAIGFITGPAEAGIQHLTPEDSVNIFLPTTPNPTSGFLLFLPRKAVRHLEMTIEEGIKMVVSGGIVTPPDRHPPEFDDEAVPESEPPIARSG